MKFILYCEIPDNKKDQIKKCVDIIGKLTPISVNNIFVNEDDTISEDETAIPTNTAVTIDPLSTAKKPYIAKPTPKNNGWEPYDNTTNMPTL